MTVSAIIALRVAIVVFGLVSIFGAGYFARAKQWPVTVGLLLGGFMILAGQALTFLAWIGPHLK